MYVYFIRINIKNCLGNYGIIILFMVFFNFCGYNRMNINIFWFDYNFF